MTETDGCRQVIRAEGDSTTSSSTHLPSRSNKLPLLCSAVALAGSICSARV
jgi:hypothetical protein